jgi:Raf kinase inhibitor-like YbhB/YbcL family protein
MTDISRVQLSVTSAAFRDGQSIPKRYTCDGEDISPELSWRGAPDGTETFAVIMDDPDAPRGVFTHWVYYNIPGAVRALPEDV